MREGLCTAFSPKGSAVAGLDAAARIARVGDASADAVRYDERAAALRAAMGRRQSRGAIATTAVRALHGD